jgi:hypothetical protein
MPAAGLLLCMGLFSIFLIGSEIGTQANRCFGSPLNQASMPSTIC